MAMIFARYLIEFNFIELLGVISVLHPSFKRAAAAPLGSLRALRFALRGFIHPCLRPFVGAQLARGTMDMIGLHAVPVAFGTDGGDVAGEQRAPEPTNFSYMPPDGSERSFSLETGRTLLFRTLVGAASKSVIVCIISSLKDVALFLRDNEALFAAKVKEVSIMGGVVSRDDDDKDDEALLVPDTAHNNMFDKPAADFFYRRCQELGVRLIVVGRDCAYQVKIPRPKGSGRRFF